MSFGRKKPSWTRDAIRRASTGCIVILKSRDLFAHDRHRLLDLGVAQVRSRSEAKSRAPAVGEDPSPGQARAEFRRARRAEGKKTTHIVERHGSVAVDRTRIGVERVEEARQQAHLVPAHLAEDFRHQSEVVEKIEDCLKTARTESKNWPTRKN